MHLKTSGRHFSTGGKRKVRGASLIEVLVSVLLAAIGLLALAGANVSSIRYSKLSQYRGTANMLALDLAERMRADPAGLVSYKMVDDFAAQATLPNASTACQTYAVSKCGSAAIAAYDLVAWRRLVRSQLPEGSVSVATSTSVSAADVWVAWRDPAVADSSENSTDSRNNAKECPDSFSSDKSVRCSYFRINL